MSLDTNALMDALGGALDAIPGLRVYDYPPDAVSVPAAVVAYPDSITYDDTFQRGTDSATATITVLVGRVSDRASRDALAAYLAGTGAMSVKAAVDGTLGGVVKDARVGSASVLTVTVGAVEYVAANFSVEVYS